MLLLNDLGCATGSNSEKKSTEATEKLISQSGKLQKIDKLCRSLPVFKESEPKVKSISRTNDTLFYYYKLKPGFDEVQSQVREYLLKEGWVLKREGSGSWENQIEFEKDNYWIQINFNEFTELNYATNCKELSKPNEQTN